MELNSSIWVIVIVLGAMLVTIGNIKYNQARERETSQDLATHASALLQPELVRNLTVLKEMQEHVKNEKIKLLAFDVAAWETVSGGGLLLGYKPSEHSKLMKIYQQFYQVNILHSRLMDAVVGVSQPKAGGKTIIELFLKELEVVLDQIEPLLLSLIKSKKQS